MRARQCVNAVAARATALYRRAARRASRAPANHGTKKLRAHLANRQIGLRPGASLARITTGLGWRSDGKLVWTDSGLVAALVTLAVLPAVGTGQAGSLTAGVAAVRGDGLSLVLSLHHGHGRQPGRFVVRSHGLHMAPGNVGHVWYVWYMGHGCQHTERMVAAAYTTARYLEKYFCKRIYTIWVTSFYTCFY